MTNESTPSGALSPATDSPLPVPDNSQSTAADSASDVAPMTSAELPTSAESNPVAAPTDATESDVLPASDTPPIASDEPLANAEPPHGSPLPPTPAQPITPPETPSLPPETPAPSPPPALLEAALPEPPRALVPGAFLRFEFEIKQVLVRGFTNLYLAQAGDYGATVPKIIAEREVPVAPAPITPTTAPPISAEATGAGEAAATPPAISERTGHLEDALREDEEEMSSGALLNEALADHSFAVPPTPPVVSTPTAPHPMPTPSGVTLPVGFVPAPATADVSGAAPDATLEDASLTAALFPPCENFVQDDREYQVYDFVETTALQDYREPTNDTRYLQALGTLAHGLQELEARHLHATLTRDILRFDSSGALRYYGFYDAASPAPTVAATVPPIEPAASVEGDTAAPGVATPAPIGALEQLRGINAFLLKRVFAESSTMRLGDEFGSLCLTEEVKELARRLHEHELPVINAVVAAVDAIYQPAANLRVEAALLSNVGQERALNEDAGMIIRLQRAAHLGSYYFDLYVVADGMGGHEGGEVASNLTLTSLQRNLALRSNINWDDNIAAKQALQEIIDAVNADVVALTETPHYRMMRAKPGSTLVFGVRVGSRVFIGNVGDSRAYKYNELSGLQRISKDHSYVQSLLDRGEITEEEAWDHPEGSIITAHIGDPRLKTRDVFLRLCAPGDKLLFVSDGVVDMLRDRDIAVYLHNGDATAICHNLIEASNAAGGLDNITAICVTFAQ